MGSPVNVSTIGAINEKIAELQTVKSKIDSFLSKEHKSIHEELLIKYIELQNVISVSEYANSKGYQIRTDESCHKYTHADISSLIKAPRGELDADENLIDFVKALFNFNKGKITWNMLVKQSKK